MKTSQKLFLGLLFFGQLSMASMKEVGNKANEDMAATMNTVVNGSASVLACSIIGRGIKNSFTTLQAIDNAVADPAINYGCAALYAMFLTSRAFALKSENSEKPAQN